MNRRAMSAALTGGMGIFAGLVGALVRSPVLGILAGVAAVLVAHIAVRALRETQAVEQRVDALEDIAVGLRRSFDEERRSLQELRDIEQARRDAEAVEDDVDLTPEQLIVDGETGLRSAAYFSAALEDRLAVARRHLRPVTVVICELIPATAAGRPVAAHDVEVVARCIQRTLRDCDVACRLAESRFGLLLEDTADTSAVWAMERLRRQVQMELSFRVRAGIASYPTHGLDGEQVLAHADRALEQVATQPGHAGIQVAPALD